MNFLRWTVAAIFSFFITLSFSQEGTLWPTSESEVVDHAYFKLEYSEEHEEAVWVYYQEHPNNLKGTAERISHLPLVLLFSFLIREF